MKTRAGGKIPEIPLTLFLEIGDFFFSRTDPSVRAWTHPIRELETIGGWNKRVTYFRASASRARLGIKISLRRRLPKSCLWAICLAPVSDCNILCDCENRHCNNRLHARDKQYDCSRCFSDESFIRTRDTRLGEDRELCRPAHFDSFSSESSTKWRVVSSRVRYSQFTWIKQDWIS